MSQMPCTEVANCENSIMLYYRTIIRISALVHCLCGADIT